MIPVSPLGWTPSPTPGRFEARESGATLAVMASQSATRFAPTGPRTGGRKDSASSVAIGGAVASRRRRTRRAGRRGFGALLAVGENEAGSDGFGALDVVIVALAPLPLVAWRLAPLAVFVVTALASSLAFAVAEPAGPPDRARPSPSTCWRSPATDRASARGSPSAWWPRCSACTSWPAASSGRRSCSGSPSGAARGSPATGPGCAASGWPSSRSARCAPSARPSASAAWRRPRSAGASPATCTTRPVTRST